MQFTCISPIIMHNVATPNTQFHYQLISSFFILSTLSVVFGITIWMEIRCRSRGFKNIHICQRNSFQQTEWNVLESHIKRSLNMSWTRIENVISFVYVWIFSLWCEMWNTLSLSLSLFFFVHIVYCEQSSNIFLFCILILS